MKSHTKTIIAMIAAMTITSIANADTTASGTIVYDSNAAIYSIHNSPNPVQAQVVEHAEMVYVNQANGPAIYSYPSRVEPKAVKLEMIYVDQAYGQAIYSYPHNH
ncbi:hypothetical protein JCM14076_16190 [Methylosoma difficile]